MFYYVECVRGSCLRQRERVRAAIYEGRVVQDPVGLHLQLEGQGDHRARPDLRKGLPRIL